ncbi:MAG: M18 family aminopeptidase [Candidatus Onthovivens sp.]|nr:M18 family aminopeptidase [Mollicutes bacterium]MDY4183104.1 M18 family aminopeptidase [Candidatus Onthovivens sp.]
MENKIKEESINKLLLDLFNNSYNEYFAISNIKKLLDENGFICLLENEKYEISLGKSYYILRDGSSIIAFKVPEKLDELYFKIVASHSDSPVLKIKENPTIIENGYNKLKVEKYGGMIVSSWLDKPLGIAGRVCYKNGNAITTRLVNFPTNLIIPNVAIHQNRDINNGFVYNPQIDLLPILGLGNNDLFKELLDSTRNNEEEILSYDLNLYNKEKAVLGGINNEFIYSPKEDNLVSAYISILSLISSISYDGISLGVVFNNEEVGSSSLNGADSDFLATNLKRISKSLGFSNDELSRALVKSYLVSLDNAHAIHPNHPEMSDNKNNCLINEGVVIKHNSNMLYTSEAISSAIIKLIASKENISLQTFFNRADARGGSTLGNISLTHVSIRSVDLGIPQLAMHSNYEVMGSKDTINAYKLLKALFNSKIKIEGENVTII